MKQASAVIYAGTRASQREIYEASTSLIAHAKIFINLIFVLPTRGSAGAVHSAPCRVIPVTAAADGATSEQSPQQIFFYSPCLCSGAAENLPTISRGDPRSGQPRQRVPHLRYLSRDNTASAFL